MDTLAIDRVFDAQRINEIVNHPDVYPWVKGIADGPLDLTHLVAENDSIFALLGRHGAIIFHRLQPGVFESHSQCLPEGRGEWMVAFTRACLRWMFTRTDALEFLTRCPQGNTGAKALARAIGGSFEFQNQRGWVLDGKVVPADIYALRIQDWIRSAPGLVEKGQWFHGRLEAELARLGASELAHPDDSEHDRHVGAAVEMFFGGQPHKGAIFYNRFACLGGYQPVSIVSVDPLAVDIGTAVLVMQGDDFVIPCMTAQN